MSFPSELKNILPEWVREGLLEQSQADAIARRHALDETSPGTTGLLLPAIYILGVFLIGGGTISFVAAHWDTIPVGLRIGGLVALMAACEIAGYVLWKVRGTHARLGQALITLGSVVFGASIFLVAQMLHLHGPPHGAFALWTIGALALAYATGNVTTMGLACLVSLSWATSWVEIHPHQIFWYPIALVVGCIPFLLRRSVLVLAALLFAGAVALITSASVNADHSWAPLMMAAALAALYRALGLWFGRRDEVSDFALPARLIGGVALIFPAFFHSFHMGPEKPDIKEIWMADGWLWSGWLIVIWLAVAVVSSQAYRLPAARAERTHGSWAMVVGSILFTAGISSGHHILLPIAANLALVGVAAGLIWDALETSDRRAFWLGLGLLSVLLVSRFFEWDTHLIVKSAGFILCGIGVMVGGVRFERHLKGVQP